MRQRIAAVTAAAALAIAGNVAVAGNVASAGASPAGVASAGAAQAAVTCHVTGFTPNTVVVGLSPVVGVTFNVRTAGCSRLAKWDLGLGTAYDPGGEPGEVYPAYGVDSVNPRFFVDNPKNYQAGSIRAEASVTEWDSINGTWVNIPPRIWESGFRLKRANGWGRTFNAGPEPVRKGRAITVQGKLSMANWDTNRYQGHGSQSVKVQFRTPTGSYATVKTIKTNAYGWAKTKVTARRTGVWRLVYSGNNVSGPATALGDTVKVR